MKHLLPQSIALTAAMLITGCGDSAAPESTSSGGDSTATMQITPAPKPAQEIAVQVMPLADFNTEVSSQSKVVVVDLWASW